MTPRRLAGDLALAFGGTAFFLRALGEVPDGALTEPARVPGWTRAMVAADVGYRARALARLLDGDEEYPHPSYRLAEVHFGASLAPRALRHLVAHSAVQLRVAFRDVVDEPADVRGLPWWRARNVWLHAVDLRIGPGLRDLPTTVLHRLIEEARPDALLNATDPQAARLSLPGGGAPLVAPLSELAGFVTGRGPCPQGGPRVEPPAALLP